MKVRYARIPNGPAIEMEGDGPELIPVIDFLLSKENGHTGTALPAPTAPALPPAAPPEAAAPLPSASTGPVAPVTSSPAARHRTKKEKSWPKARRVAPVDGRSQGRRIDPVKRTKIVEKAADLIEKRPEITHGQLSKELGVSDTTVRASIRPLAEKLLRSRKKAKPEIKPPSAPPLGGRKLAETFPCARCDRSFGSQHAVDVHVARTHNKSTRPVRDPADDERTAAPDPEAETPVGSRPLPRESDADPATVVSIIQDHLKGISPYQLARNYQMKEAKISRLLDHAYELLKILPAPAGTPGFRSFYENRMDSEERLEHARRILRDLPDSLT